MASKALPCLLLLLAASVTGCASTRDRNAATDDGSSSGAYTSAPSDGGVRLAGDNAGALPPGVQSSVIYFAYDSDTIDSAGQQSVAAWARYLSANPTVTVRLEGHADERGTTQYNEALGERRALAVRAALTAAGAAVTQLNTLSYGEIRPAAQGHDEQAWAKNRRVEVVR